MSHYKEIIQAIHKCSCIKNKFLLLILYTNLYNKICMSINNESLKVLKDSIPNTFIKLLTKYSDDTDEDIDEQDIIVHFINILILSNKDIRPLKPFLKQYVFQMNNATIPGIINTINNYHLPLSLAQEIYQSLEKFLNFYKEENSLTEDEYRDLVYYLQTLLNNYLNNAKDHLNIQELYEFIIAQCEKTKRSLER